MLCTEVPDIFETELGVWLTESSKSSRASEIPLTELREDEYLFDFEERKERLSERCSDSESPSNMLDFAEFAIEFMSLVSSPSEL